MVRVSDEQILDATVRTVLAGGYGGATTRGIAAAAGINEVTLFRRFGDKQSLVRAAIAQQVAAFGLQGPAHTGDLDADLLRVLEFYARVFRGRGRLLITLLAEVPRRPELAEVVRQPLAVITELLDMIRTYQQAGRLRPGPPADLLNALLGPLLVEALSERITPHGPGPRPAPPSPRQHLRSFLHGNLTGTTDATT